MKMECADIVVLVPNENGYYLLAIRRGKNPFAGMWALPGGRVNIGEESLDAAVRELSEETNLFFESDDFEFVGAFDKPGRDPRCEETISYAYVIELDYAPKCVPGDDAIECEWVQVSKDGKVLGGLAFDHEDIVFSAIRKIQDVSWNIKFSATGDKKSLSNDEVMEIINAHHHPKMIEFRDSLLVGALQKYGIFGAWQLNKVREIEDTFFRNLTVDIQDDQVVLNSEFTIDFSYSFEEDDVRDWVFSESIQKIRTNVHFVNMENIVNKVESSLLEKSDEIHDFVDSFSSTVIAKVRL